MKEPTWGLWDPLRWPETTTKVVGVVVMVCVAGEGYSLQVRLDGYDLHNKNHKNEIDARNSS